MLQYVFDTLYDEVISTGVISNENKIIVCEEDEVLQYVFDTLYDEVISMG